MSEVEVLETTGTELEVRPIGQVSIYASTEPEAQLNEAKARAKVLFDVVKEQGLARTFGGNPKPHVQVEGWQFLGSQFGLIADIEWTKELEDGWEARAAIRRLSDGLVISHAEAECRRSESNWKSRDSYVIRSMAQTRATSKVFRNALSSVMVMAGFAGTPAEEMDGVHTSRSAPARPRVEPVSTGDPHCPACLAVNGELVGVSYRNTKPFWKCLNDADKCAGSEKDKSGKAWSWSGWLEEWRPSAEQWLNEHGFEGVAQPSEPDQSVGEWMANAVQAFTKWSDEQRRGAYKAVMEDLEYDSLESREQAEAVFEGMAASYYVEFPSDGPF